MAVYYVKIHLHIRDAITTKLYSSLYRVLKVVALTRWMLEIGRFRSVTERITFHIYWSLEYEI